MIIPPKLKKDDKIAIVSTARKIEFSEISETIAVLEEWGLQVVIGETIGKVKDQYAGSDQARVKDFQQMIDDPSVNAILCARGGYGTVRIIDSIDFSEFKKYPKWIIGYSDITVLHSHIHNFSIATLHATLALDLAKSTDLAQRSLRKAVFEGKLSYTIKSDQNNKFGKSSGQLIGGNLSILYSLCGSPSHIDTKGKILFLEDLDEYLYHIDRIFQNLKRNGMLKHLSGLIIGGMTQMHDNTIPFGKTIEEIVLASVQEYDFPVVFDFPAGHIRDNRALILGIEATLTVKKTEVKLSF